jgi:hypothetical protein
LLLDVLSARYSQNGGGVEVSTDTNSGTRRCSPIDKVDYWVAYGVKETTTRRFELEPMQKQAGPEAEGFTLAVPTISLRGGRYTLRSGFVVLQPEAVSETTVTQYRGDCTDDWINQGCLRPQRYAKAKKGRL